MKYKIALLGCLLLSPSAWADTKSDGAEQALSSSGGIVAPGGPTAVFQNPAGLTLNSGFAFTGQAGASDSFQQPFLRAGLIGGGASYGLIGGLTQTTSDAKSTSAFYGLGVAASAGLSIGVAGQTGISNAGGTSLNAGILFSGSLPINLGFTAFGLEDGVQEWGAGISNKSGPVYFLLDGAYNSRSKHFGLKPGVKVGNPEAALSLSYGLADAGSTLQLSEGFTVGGSLIFGSGSIQAYYNDFAKFYLAVTFML